MARTFRQKRQAQPIAELNLTNLIDLGFTLLIIFMIATPLINQEQSMKLNLPVTSRSPQTASKDTKAQVISIDQQGRYFWGNPPVAVTLTELTSRLNALAAQSSPPVISIHADADVKYQKVMTVLDELKKRGLERINLPSQPDR
jgi:biopolymer transport protein TolR